ncbi:adenylyltransferase/cytidyltransferase family protein [Marinobacter sp. LV10MA510-1]|uniref:adenylyltransferase/cytidyltransferase family protein n=1 Tax=Marinobacter sp. LV10MA510-1 TaxID=1415567 RepID=UPI000BF5BBCC|nr:adenylyltransferase/cytidyltransferase family protein [Marinobacter sp. LV10MA510-1]PFG11734.1 glycerol-3-phosphate cytidylyltransferase [Marinobacter sp. LV10MA510-1]
MKIIMTYGTFDLFHIGHLNMLERLAALGDQLIVGVSTDEFNRGKGKESIFSYEERSRIVQSISCVDHVVPETTWEQKRTDIQSFNVDLLGIGEDWQGKFDHLKELCEVVYLSRTAQISTTQLKQRLSDLNSKSIREIRNGLDSLLNVVKALE